MFTKMRKPIRMTAFVFCCLLANTACIDIFGIGDILSNATPESEQASEANAATFTKSLSIVNPPAELQVDKKHQLLAIVSDSNNERILDAATAWVSSAPDIVSVDSDGITTPLRPGQATISATFARLNDAFKVQVVDDIPHKITLQTTELELHELDEFTLEAVVTNRFGEIIDTPVTWSAENSRILRFRKDGTIFARSPGITQIHATAGEIQESIKTRIEPIGEQEFRQKAALLTPQTPEAKAAAADAKATAHVNTKTAKALVEPIKTKIRQQPEAIRKSRY